MKMTLIVFGIMVAFIAVLMFGSVGLSRVMRWLGWPQDVLVAVGMVFIIAAGLCLCAWRIGVMEDRLERLEQRP